MHNMKLQEAPFNLIKSGEKTIELRLLDEKRKQIKIGDLIRFYHNDNSSIFVDANVIDLHISDCFDNLFECLDITKAGFDNIGELQEIMQKYYPLEEQNKLGVVGIEIERI